MIADFLRRKFESPLVKAHRVDPSELGEVPVNYLFGLFHPRLHVIAPDWFANYLRQYQGKYGFTHSTDYARAVKTRRIILVYHDREERRMVARVRRSNPSRTVWSFTYDVLPKLIARTRHFVHAEPFHTGPLAAVRRYAVVCTPRAGSTFLCNMMWQANAGRPREHLRYPLVYLKRNTTFSPERLAVRIMRSGTVNNIFGTKFIAHFIKDVFPKKSDRLQFAEAIKKADFRILHLRRPTVDQAISRYIAKNTGTWHVYNEISDDYQRRLRNLPYDFKTMKRIYDDFADEEATVREFLSVWDEKEILALDYEELDAAPMTVLHRVASFTRLPMEFDAVDLTAAPVKISRRINLHAEFVRRFAADLEKSSVS